MPIIDLFNEQEIVKVKNSGKGKILKHVFMYSILFLIFFSIARGNENLENVIYLKNGNIIPGAILEQLIGKSTKIQTYDKDILVFSAEDIEKITGEPLADASNLKSKSSQAVKSLKNRRDRYYGILRVGTKIGEEHPLYEANIINGIKVGEHFSYFIWSWIWLR